MIKVYITTAGIGSRLKNLSPKDKHLLYYKNKKIINWIKEIIPNSIEFCPQKTNNRKETLSFLKNESNCLIIDCDIIPIDFDATKLSFEEDFLFAFHSNKPKWGSIIVENDRLVKCSESKNISNIKCSGIYFIKSIEKLLNQMIDPNSIASGMIGAKIFYENTFLRLGDVEDYFNTIEIPI
jgi:dTDP-glucose pyrophosphorylase